MCQLAARRWHDRWTACRPAARHLIRAVCPRPSPGHPVEHLAWPALVLMSVKAAGDAGMFWTACSKTSKIEQASPLPPCSAACLECVCAFVDVSFWFLLAAAAVVCMVNSSTNDRYCMSWTVPTTFQQQCAMFGTRTYRPVGGHWKASNWLRSEACCCTQALPRLSALLLCHIWSHTWLTGC